VKWISQGPSKPSFQVRVLVALPYLHIDLSRGSIEEENEQRYKR
jgi:hypothetical protein